jgi:hypothetical protein
VSVPRWGRSSKQTCVGRSGGGGRGESRGRRMRRVRRSAPARVNNRAGATARKSPPRPACPNHCPPQHAPAVVTVAVVALNASACPSSPAPRLCLRCRCRCRCHCQCQPAAGCTLPFHGHLLVVSGPRPAALGRRGELPAAFARARLPEPSRLCGPCADTYLAPLQRSDSSHLLGDPYQPHYGSINQPSAHSPPQADPEEIRRQRDALERICAQTSE